MKAILIDAEHETVSLINFNEASETALYEMLGPTFAAMRIRDSELMLWSRDFSHHTFTMPLPDISIKASRALIVGSVKGRTVDTMLTTNHVRHGIQWNGGAV